MFSVRSVSAALLAVGCCCFLLSGCRDSAKARGSRPALTSALDRSAVLATVALDEKLEPMAVPPSLGSHSAPSATGPEYFFSERGGGVAYVIEKEGKFQVVHNGRAGKPYAALGAVALSPDGQRCAFGALVDGKWRMVADGAEGQPFSAVRAPVFSPDGRHLAYQAMAGERWHLVVDAIVNAGTQTRFVSHEFGGDSSKIVFIDDADDQERGRLVVSDLAFKSQTVVDASVSSLLMSADRTRVAAVSRSGARQRLIVFGLERPESVEKGPLNDAVYAPAFAPDGASVAYVAERSGERFMVLDGKEEPYRSNDMVGMPVVRPDGKAVAALVPSATGQVVLRQFFLDGGGAGPAYEDAGELVYSGDGSSYAFAARKGARWFVVVGGREGPALDRVVSPVFSPDGRRVVYRARMAGKRFVIIAATDGTTVRQLPAYEMVFSVIFTADGKSVAYGVKDGQQLSWKVEPL